MSTRAPRLAPRAEALPGHAASVMIGVVHPVSRRSAAVAYPLDAPLTRDDKHAPGYAAIRVRHGAGSALSAHHPNGAQIFRIEPVLE